MEILLSIIVFLLIASGILFLAGKGIEKLVQERTSTPEQRDFLIQKAERKRFKKMLKQNAKNRDTIEAYEDVDVDKFTRMHQQRKK